MEDLEPRSAGAQRTAARRYLTAMGFVVRVIVNGLALIAVAYLVPGV